MALESASVILFVVDGRDGLTAYDQRGLETARYLNVPIITVVNKGRLTRIARAERGRVL